MADLPFTLHAARCLPTGLERVAVALWPMVALGCAAPRAPYTAEELDRAVLVEEMVLRPDGREIAFTTDRTGAFELWTLALDGGGAAAAAPRRRTSEGEHVTGLAYAPDGSALVFANDRGGDERTDLFLLRDGEGAAPERLTQTARVAERSARFSPDARSIVFSCDVDLPGRYDVCTLDLATRETRRLTHETTNVVSPIFLAGGRGVVATRTPDDQRGDLVVVDAAGTRVVPPLRPDGIAFAKVARASGDVVAIALDDEGFMRLAQIDPSSGASRYVGPGGWDVDEVAASSAGVLLVLRNVRGASEVTFGDRALMSTGYADAVDVDAAGRVVAIAGETPERPANVATILSPSGPAVVVVPADLAGIDPSLLGDTTLRGFTSFDGQSIDAYVTTPPVRRLGDPPPAVVYVHGGPDSEVHPWWDPLVVALSEAGFVVVRANYRGSVGYGRAFRDRNDRDWGGGDLQDLVAVVHALAAEGAIDLARVGITGGSYGGYMTLRAITKEPGMWRAAAERYGMADLEEDYRLSDASFKSWYLKEMGDPEKDAALYRDRSPIHALGRITAPLLVMQGANDTNVPRREADAMVAAMRARGQRVEYVVYANEGHEFTKRENRVDADGRTVAFFVNEMGARR
jgi:dipeptidyl aminopeptidase/acylaminoacyl peptidase